ncbi:BTB/POZ domain-containing protein At5g41330 [Typha angustifolia]|uniref:BTB/POZ domain-containing protein At5g41330 n=1 Tax=Typha angustifolia TaxID=59011 RepID=UPI003C2F861C
MPPNSSNPTVVTLNVGGQLFQTTPETLSQAGPDSLLSSLALSSLSLSSSSSSSSSSSPFFLDRDPKLFSVLLSFLRLGRLPSLPSSISLDDVLSEADFYSLSPLLLSSFSDPDLFDPFTLLPSLSLPLPGRDPVTALSASAAGIVSAHGGKLTAFDPFLRRRATVLTPFPAVDSLLSLSPSLAAAGAVDFAGLHLVPLHRHRIPSPPRVLHWSPHPSAANSGNVLSIAASPDLLFASFESSRRNASAIVAFDLETFEPLSEFARMEVFGAEIDAAIPSSMLDWIPSSNLLLSAGSHAGPSGLSGSVRLWDVRTKNAVWELKEKNDCFSDIAASDALSAVFKVGVNSGEVFMVDLRKLGAEEEPWTCIGKGRKAAIGNGGKKEGSGCRIGCGGRQVFVSRGGDVEMWTEVAMGEAAAVEKRRAADWALEERVMRRNWMGREKDRGGKKITQLTLGGNRMVVARKDEMCVEVWESSRR